MPWQRLAACWGAMPLSILVSVALGIANGEQPAGLPAAEPPAGSDPLHAAPAFIPLLIIYFGPGGAAERCC